MFNAADAAALKFPANFDLLRPKPRRIPLKVKDLKLVVNSLMLIIVNNH